MESEKQHIRCNTIIEVLGKPKEHVESSIKDYVEKIKQDKDLIVLKEEYAETKELDNYWSSFVELEIVVKGIPKLIGFCFDYMPSTMEILKPDKMILENKAIADFLTDLQARLHTVDMTIKQLKSENEFVKKNMGNVIKNIIFLALVKSSLTLQQLSKITGIVEKELEIYINKLIEENRIEKEGEVYSLAKNEPKAQN